MITINKETTNNIIFTLTERSTLGAPSYLFSFIDDNTRDEVLFNMEDLSGYPRRYNQFELIESGTTYTNLSDGIINLDYGFGTYTVYESVTPTLDISGTTGTVLEKGKYFVNGWRTEYDNNPTQNIYL
tara:strand:+ start:6216 stop:6599 length:384 start_codon:yes stop_codon:yes gene_type:complete